MLSWVWFAMSLARVPRSATQLSITSACQRTVVRQDAPEGSDAVVENSKGGNICNTCTYVHRGSFEEMKNILEFITTMQDNPPLEEQSLSSTLVEFSFCLIKVLQEVINLVNHRAPVVQ